jgi:beta-lactamase regulating signal transducer with metallopeptidase domain
MRARRRRRTNPILSAIIFFVVGVILVIVAITTDPNNVTCDGQTMSAGDQCIHTVNGVQTSVEDIDQQRQSQQNDRIFEIIGAVLCFAVGAFIVMRLTKTRAALKNGAVYTAPQSAASQQPGNYPPPQGGYPQQPGAYPPPLNGYPQPNTPSEPGPYPPTPNGYPPQQ